MAWLDYVNAAGIIAALGLSSFQTRRLVVDARLRDEERRTERALELYKAFESLSVLLRNEGARRYIVNTWFVMDEKELQSGGMLDPGRPGLDTAFQNFYRIMWYFERVKHSMDFKLANPEVLLATVGYHCWWWGQLLKNITSPKAIDALHALAPLAADWARRHDVYAVWMARCQHDFNGAAPADL